MDSVISQIFVNGLIVGAIYSLVASGFSLIYYVCKFVHFAHGATITFSGYFLYFLYFRLGLNFSFSVVLTVIFGSLFGYLMNSLFYKPLRNRKASSVILLIASVALLIFFESLILLLFGPDVKTIGLIKISAGVQILGAVITPLQIFIITSSIILLIFLFVFIKKTKLGKAMRAVADNRDIAEIVGIPSEKIYTYTFMIASLIAGIGGILIGLEQNLDPTMGTHLMIKGFTAAIVGGIGSVPGSILGSFLLGLVENFGIWFLPSSYKDAIAFAILFIFLLFKPTGILGIKQK